MVHALEGIKVVDMSQVAAVPMAARHLADFGADVIHIEHPLRGDSWRVFQAREENGPGFGAPSQVNYNWENYNRNKRSVTIDISQQIGRDILYTLVEKADVFLTNLRMFEREKFRLEYDTLSRLNPRLIYGSLTGYGKEGPDRDNPGYDSIAYWARPGLGYMFATQGAPPSVDGGAFGDNVAALGLAFGIMMALYVRVQTGLGQEVDLSLFHTGIYQSSFFISGALTTGLDLQDWAPGSREDVNNPLVLPFETKDGRWLLLALVQPDRYWEKFCKAIDREDLVYDPRFGSFQTRIENRAHLYHTVEEAFHRKTLNEWKVQLEGIPFAPYQTLLEVVNDPQARANNVFITYNHPTYGNMEVIANPVELSKTPAIIRMPAPEFSQHTEEVLLEYGYTWEDVAKLKEQGIIA